MREENLSSLPMTLRVDAQKLADQLVEKSAAEAVKTEKMSCSSPSIMPGELSDGLPKLEGWTEAALKTIYYADPKYSGITVIPEHNRRHVIAIERIAKPVFAKSCLQPLGCTDAGTETEPAANFGQLQIYLPAPASKATASVTQNKNTPPWYMVPIGWLLDQVVPPAQANPLVFQTMKTQIALGAAAGTAGTANDNGGSWETESGAPPLISEKEKLFMAAIVSSTPESQAQAAWGALKRAFGADSDTAQHQLERLKQLADQKGRAETRVRYRFMEDKKTGGMKVVGYHTREGSGMDTVKVRHVKQTAPGTYEFREDGTDSPILVWYTNASSMYKALSPQELPQYFNQRGTPINVNTVPLDDPSMTGQTPGLEIPEQPTWRDGVMDNPQQDPNEIAGNKTETPISDGTDQGPTKTTTPVQESDFRDYILVFPIEDVPAVYVYLSSSHGKGSGLIDGIPKNPGTARRFMSKKEFKHFQDEGFVYDPEDPRGGISVTSVKVDPKNPDAIKRSTGALGADYYVDIDTAKKHVELKGKTKGGVMDWKIKDNVTNEDIINSGRVRK
nr:S-type pyocin domain-containing protein [Xenorhabdus bovienii]